MTDKTIKGYEAAYTQADLNAAVAAALEDAARSACEWWADDDPRELSAHLRRLYPDARATLKTRDQAQIAEGMRRALTIVRQHDTGDCRREDYEARRIAERIRDEAEKMGRGEG